MTDTPDPIDVIANIAIQWNRDGTPMRMLVDRSDATTIVTALKAVGLRVVPEVDDDTRREVERYVAEIRRSARNALGASANYYDRLADLLSRLVLGEVTE